MLLLSFCLRDLGIGPLHLRHPHTRTSPEFRPSTVPPSGTCACYAFGGGMFPFQNSPRSPADIFRYTVDDGIIPDFGCGCKLFFIICSYFSPEARGQGTGGGDSGGQHSGPACVTAGGAGLLSQIHFYTCAVASSSESTALYCRSTSGFTRSMENWAARSCPRRARRCRRSSDAIRRRIRSAQASSSP